MKKIILGTVLACLASGSVMADGWFPFNHYYETFQNNVKLHCKWVGDYDWNQHRTPKIYMKVVGNNETLTVRLTDDTTGEVETKFFSSGSYGMNEEGEDRYYESIEADSPSAIVHIDSTNDTVYLKGNHSSALREFDCLK